MPVPSLRKNHITRGYKIIKECFLEASKYLKTLKVSPNSTGPFETPGRSVCTALQPERPDLLKGHPVLDILGFAMKPKGQNHPNISK